MSEPDDALGVPERVRLALQTITDSYGVPLWLLARIYQLGARASLGPTGAFPYGDLGADDKGELAAAVETDVAHGVLRLHFGVPVTWVALPASHARQLAHHLLLEADRLDRAKF